MTRGAVAVLVVIAAIAGCDRELVPSPAARHDRRDDADARRLADQLAALPGVARASVVVHRPFVDPLAPGTATAPTAAGATASILVVATVDDAELAARVRALAAAALPDLPSAGMSLVIAPPAAPPVHTATVGPFVVAAGSRTALRATLALALLTIAGLAAFIAYRERRQRRGISPHQSSASTTRGS